MMTTKSLADLPDAIFCNITEYLDWGEVARLDNALLNRNMRKSYFDALKLRKVKVERNRFWRQLVEKGILDWLVSRNIPVVSWDSKVDNTKLMTIANGLPQLQSLKIINCDNITDEGMKALATGCPQLQSLDISVCLDITDEGITAVASGCTQLQSLDISGCGDITDAGMKALASGCTQLQSLSMTCCTNITDAGITALANGLPQLQSFKY